MNRRYFSSFLGVVVVLALIVGLTGTTVALAPIQGVYDPMNPLEFMLACCQWELMKKIELTLLGQAPDERFYTPELAALDYIPPGWESGRPPTSSSPEVQSYEASSSCCGQYAQAQAQTDVDIMWVDAQYQAWKASQAADVRAATADETSVDSDANSNPDTKSNSDVNPEEASLNTEQLLTVNETSVVPQQTQAPLVVYAHDTTDTRDTGAGNDAAKASKQSADEETCEACAEAQQFAEWLFSQPKLVTT